MTDNAQPQLQVVFSAQEIAVRVEAMAEEINQLYAGEPVTAVCVLKGAFIFFADLVRRLTMPLELDFLILSSYGNSTSQGPEIRLIKDVKTPLQGKNVLIVEDIVDTGHSLRMLMDQLTVRRPKTLRSCALVDKYERREVELEVDFRGFTLNKGFIVGYGMDHAGRYRELDGVYELLFDPADD